MKVKVLHSLGDTGELHPKKGTKTERTENAIGKMQKEYHWIDIQKGRYLSDDY